MRAGASSPVDGLEQVHGRLPAGGAGPAHPRPGDTFAALDERLPEAMLVQSPELAQQLVSTWLGSLLELSKAERGPLLDTLDAWVETSGSAGRTARRVHCHRNTVLNRLRRLSEVTGHDLTAWRHAGRAGPGVARPTAARAARLLSCARAHNAGPGGLGERRHPAAE